MITVRTQGHLHHLYRRDVSLRMCWSDKKVAQQVADRMNKEIAEKLANLKKVA